MKTFLKNLAARFTRRPLNKASKPRSAFRPRLEGLEERACPANIQQIQALGLLLGNQVATHVRQLVQDGVRAEIQAPTRLGGTIVRDLARLNADVQARNLGATFADFRTLVQHVAQEAAQVQALRLPSRQAVAANNQVVADVFRLYNDEVVTIEFATYVARQLSPTARPV